MCNAIFGVHSATFHNRKQITLYTLTADIGTTQVGLVSYVTIHAVLCYVPSMWNPLLVENAVKHNIVLPEQPLTIQITTNNEAHLTVRNNIQRKTQRRRANQYPDYIPDAGSARTYGGGGRRAICGDPAAHSPKLRFVHKSVDAIHATLFPFQTDCF